MRRVGIACVLWAGCGSPSGEGTHAETQVGKTTAPSAALAASASATAMAVLSASPAPPLSAMVSASALPEPPDPLLSPKMVDDQGQPLPQTNDKPTVASAAFQKRAELLFQAIVADDASIAAPTFFPKAAYVMVKDIPHAEKDWDARLFNLFKRDIHEYHGKLGHDPDKATFVGVTSDDMHPRWMAVGSEGNKLPYWRAFGTLLAFKNAAGREVKLEVTSIISWRGEWFVVHLHGTR